MTAATVALEEHRICNCFCESVAGFCQVPLLVHMLKWAVRCCSGNDLETKIIALTWPCPQCVYSVVAHYSVLSSK